MHNLQGLRLIDVVGRKPILKKLKSGFLLSEDESRFHKTGILLERTEVPGSVNYGKSSFG